MGWCLLDTNHCIISLFLGSLAFHVLAVKGIKCNMVSADVELHNYNLNCREIQYSEQILHFIFCPSKGQSN